MDYAKDGITVAAMLDTAHPKKSGKYPVKIRITQNRARIYYSTGKDLTPEEWEMLPKTKVRALVAVRKDIESSYQIVRAAVEELANEGRFTLETLNRRLKGAATDTLNAAFRAKMAELEAEERVGSQLVYGVVLKGLERFAGTKIAFNAISEDWVRRYEKFLRNEGKKQTTIAIHMRHLRAILNKALADGLIKNAQYPFGKNGYQIQAGEGNKKALTLTQIGQIARYDDGTEITAKYRDYWMFLYMCNGINMADFVRLKYSDIVDGEICFVRQKTERTTKTRETIHVTISEQMQDIINRWGNKPAPNAYLFPILDGKESAIERKHKTLAATCAINDRMRIIGNALGIGNITTYTARHSFATVLKRKGAKIAYISEALGHQDLKTTETYLASFEREEREKNAALLTDF